MKKNVTFDLKNFIKTGGKLAPFINGVWIEIVYYREVRLSTMFFLDKQGYEVAPSENDFSKKNHFEILSKPHRLANYIKLAEIKPYIYGKRGKND